jgi:hypothetical protein
MFTIVLRLPSVNLNSLGIDNANRACIKQKTIEKVADGGDFGCCRLSTAWLLGKRYMYIIKQEGAP